MNVTLTLPASRSAEIAASIASALMDSHRDTLNATAAREDAQSMAANATAGRELLMGTLASASIAGAWAPNEINDAMDSVAKSINDDKSRKSMTTLISEVKHACYPEGRRLFASLCTARDAAWDAEDAEKKAAKSDKRKPDDLMTRAFSRRYQTLVAMLRMVNETDPAKRIAFDLTSEDGLIEWAKARDPQRSPKALADKIAGVKDTLSEILRAVGGREPNLAAIVAALPFVTSETLEVAMNPVTDAPDLEDTEGNYSGSGEGENTEDSAGNTEEVSAVPNDPAAAFVVPRTIVQVPVLAAQVSTQAASVSEDDLDGLLAA